jgi:hypothetical protein
VKNFRFFLFILLGWLASCTPPAPGLSISPSGAVLTLGESVTLTATLQNTSVQSDIAWTSTGGVLSATTGPSINFRAEQEGVYKVTATALADPTLTRTINITVGEETRVASADVPSVSATLAGGSSKTFIIKPANLTKDALYLELVSAQALRVTLFAQSGERIATSNNPSYFSKNSTNNLLEAQTITTSRICRGPCIITPARNQGYIVTIENTATTTATYDLFIYGENFTDSLESSENCDPTFNSNLLMPAIEVIPPEPIVRAIEIVNDEDCFYSEAKAGEVTLETFSDTALAVKVSVYQVRSGVNTHYIGSLVAGPGRDDDILTFDPSYPVLIVAKSGDGRAGPSFSSRYAVNYY